MCSLVGAVSIGDVGPFQAFVITSDPALVAVSLRWPLDTSSATSNPASMALTKAGQTNQQTAGQPTALPFGQPNVMFTTQKNNKVSDQDEEKEEFDSLLMAIIASLSAAVLLVIICISGFAIAECRCQNTAIRNSKIIPFVS